jgi:hypothetical protein
VKGGEKGGAEWGDITRSAEETQPQMLVLPKQEKNTISISSSSTLLVGSLLKRAKLKAIGEETST